MIAVAGAGLLAWRIGGSIGAEMAYAAHSAGRATPAYVWVMFAACVVVPGMMLFSVVGVLARADPTTVRRVALAAAVGLYFLLPAVLHGVDLRAGPAPTIPWAVAAFLGYRYFIRLNPTQTVVG